MVQSKDNNSPVLVKKDQSMMSIVLNRPKVLNSLNHEMVRLIQKAIDEAKQDQSIRLVLLYGKGNRGFCAGGDMKTVAQYVREGDIEKATRFFRDEYTLDLDIHRYPRPTVVLADGIIMGGGLGLSSGADIVLATELTNSAMPETRIGFFPDVGATGWMFDKCPPGYPEYLGLTGYEMIGSECVRVGFATHLTDSEDLPLIIKVLANNSGELSKEKPEAVKQILTFLEPFLRKDISEKPVMDQWVKTYFDSKNSIPNMLNDLRQCSIFNDLCDGVFNRLSERSPSALMVTLKLLRHNKGQPIEEVFKSDLKAVRFILSHPDFLEGIRARLIDKDDLPQWKPDSIEKIGSLHLEL